MLYINETKKLNKLELLMEAKKLGFNIETLVANGNGIGVAFSGDGDREEGMRFMKVILDNRENIQDVMLLGAALDEANIDPEEVEIVQVEDYELLLDVNKGYVYDFNVHPLVCLSKRELELGLEDGIKKGILLERAKDFIDDYERTLEEQDIFGW